jgi:Domain of unknown function (DUF4190)
MTEQDGEVPTPADWALTDRPSRSVAAGPLPAAAPLGPAAPAAVPAQGYGQPGYGQPGYAQPGYAQPGYAPSPSGASGIAPGQPAYGQPGYAPPASGYGPQYRAPYPAPAGYGYPPPPTDEQTNGLAIAALVVGILWIYWLGSLLALLFGYIALSQIKKRGGRGRGMAIAGVVLGWIGAATLVFVIVAVTAVVHGHGQLQIGPPVPVGSPVAP